MLNFRGISFFFATLIFAITLWVFLPSLHYEFLNWDDPVVVTANPEIRSLSLENVVHMFSSYKLANYTPLGRISYALDYQIWGMNPWGFRFHNVFLHGLNACWVFVLCLRIFQLSQPSLSWGWSRYVGAFAAALIYSLHPLRIESVVWITERRDVLSLFFLLPAVICYLESKRSSSFWPGFRYGFWILWLASLLTKGTSVTLPAVLLLLDYFPIRRFELSRAGLSSLKRCLLEKVPHGLISVTMVCVAVYGITEEHGFEPFPWYLKLVCPAVYASVYLQRWLIPWPLSSFYERLLHPSDLIDAGILIQVILIFLISFYTILFARKRPAGLVCWWGYLFMIFPFAGSLQTTFGGADRYTLIPTLPFAVLIGASVMKVWDLGKFKAVRVPWVALVFSWILVLMYRTTDQMPVWRDSESLWKTAVHWSPNGAVQLNNYSSVLIEKGESYPAVVYAREAARRFPKYGDAWLNLGIASAMTERVEEAEEAYKKALERNPGLAEAHFGLGACYSKGNKQAAIHEFFLAIQCEFRIHFLNNLAVHLYHEGKSDLALKYLDWSYRKGDEEAVILSAKIWMEKGEWKKAEDLLGEAQGEFHSKAIQEWMALIQVKKGESKSRSLE